MRVHVGTSGFAYKEWKGRFYPPKIKEADMLAFYASRLDAVEINNTFYRMPSADLLARWAGQAPESFRFVLKAPRRISHVKRLADTGDDLRYLLEGAAALGPRRGPVLVQLPPFFKKDVGRLRDFLGSVPAGTGVAMEFRHESWDDAEVHAVLAAHGAARCLADTDEGTPPLVSTAPWGYLRLRRAEYDDAALAGWVDEVAAQDWAEAWVFFKHEDEARGPELAERFRSLL